MKRAILPVVLLFLAVALAAFSSDLYPIPTNPSWGAVWRWGQPLIASGTTLPDIASGATGDLFILSPAYEGTPKVYRHEYINSESGLLASWVVMAGGSGGGGVAVYDDLAGRPTSASWTYSEISGNHGTPTSASWTHDDLSTVTESTGHDGRYARPASNDPTYWQGPQVIGGNGNYLQLASGSEIVAIHDGLIDAFLTIRRYSDTAGTQIFGGSTADDGASIILSGQNANTGPKCAVTITAHGGAGALDGAINMRTYDATAAQVLDRFQVGRSGVVRVVPADGAPGDETDHVWWNVTDSEPNRGCMYFDSTDEYLYLTASQSGSVDWWPVGRAGGDPEYDFDCDNLTAAGAVQGAHVASDTSPGITQTVSLPYEFGVSTWTLEIKDGLITGVTIP